MSRGELQKNRSLIWTRKRTCCVIGFFSTTLNCDITAFRCLQPWESSALSAREHSQEQKIRSTNCWTCDASYLQQLIFYFFKILNARNCWDQTLTIRFRIFVPVKVLVCSGLSTPQAEQTDKPCYHSVYSY